MFTISKIYKKDKLKFVDVEANWEGGSAGISCTPSSIKSDPEKQALRLIERCPSDKGLKQLVNLLKDAIK